MKNGTPGHYKRTEDGIEVIEVIEQFKLGFNLGNAVKYILRAGEKGPRDADLIKALRYVYREVHGEWPPPEGPVAVKGVDPDFNNCRCCTHLMVWVESRSTGFCFNCRVRKSGNLTGGNCHYCQGNGSDHFASGGV